MTPGSHLDRLESEAIAILRDGVAEARNPVILFSAGKDSTVLAYLALKAFYPAPPPLPLLHVDSTWEFSELIAFRDWFASEFGFELHVHANEQGRRQGINPFEHGDVYTSVMRTEALKQALDAGGYDCVFGGARRDEEASRAKERIVSVRNARHAWDPRRQRPELWRVYNWRLMPGESARVYPLSNWTELDLWHYILLRRVPLASLYFARERRVVQRGDTLICVDDPARMHWNGAAEQAYPARVRFRTLGCWPVTGATPSGAADLLAVVREVLQSQSSERRGRISDAGSLEHQKREGYF